MTVTVDTFMKWNLARKYHTSSSVAARSDELVSCHSVAGIAGSNPAESMVVCLLVSVVCLPGKGLCVGLITRQEGFLLIAVFLSVITLPTKCGGPVPTRGCCALREEKGKLRRKLYVLCHFFY